MATVNGETITQHEWREAMEANFGQQVLDDLINQRVLQTAAAQAGIEVTQEEIDAAVELYVLPQFGDHDALNEYLAAVGVSRAELDDDVREFLISEKLLLEHADISEEQARQLFESDPAGFLPPDMDPAEVDLAEITFEMVEDEVYRQLAEQQLGGVPGLVQQLRAEAEIEIHLD